MIEKLYNEAMKNFNEYVHLLYLQTLIDNLTETSKKITDDLLEDYLKKRGYTMNYILGKRVMVKDFTCVFFENDIVEVWTDKTNNKKSLIIKDSLLTNLPIALNYFERI